LFTSVSKPIDALINAVRLLTFELKEAEMKDRRMRPAQQSDQFFFFFFTPLLARLEGLTFCLGLDLGGAWRRWTGCALGKDS